MLTKTELYILSYYRACELAGSILFGRLAFHTEIDVIRTKLTHHCLEEAEHAWLWTKTIEELGATPEKVTHVYQTELGKEFGMPRTTLEIFCLTQIFEIRTMQHFTMHRDMKGVHPLIKKALQKMIEDENGHLGWIKHELNTLASNGNRILVEKTMKKIGKIDAMIYKRIMSQSPFQEYFHYEKTE